MVDRPVGTTSPILDAVGEACASLARRLVNRRAGRQGSTPADSPADRRREAGSRNLRCGLWLLASGFHIPPYFRGRSSTRTWAGYLFTCVFFQGGHHA